MIDLRQAAQQALEALESLQGGCTDHDDGTVEAITVWCPEVIDALRSALEQQQAEPVETYIHAYRSQPHPNDFGIPKGHWWKAKQYADALYTTPPQRQWQGLTDEDMKDPKTHILDFICGARWAEAKLKERNNG